MDPMHGVYLHATSHSMAEGDKRAEMKVRKTPTGLMFEKVGQRDVNFDWVELGDTGAMWLRLAIPYKKRYGPGGNFGIVGFATPVDETHCQVFFWRTRKVRAGSATSGASCTATGSKALHWAVLEQDQFVLESLPDDARNARVPLRARRGPGARAALDGEARDRTSHAAPRGLAPACCG